ncbi:PilZ domain-containing protein, partial [Streptococcus pyogenes]
MRLFFWNTHETATVLMNLLWTTYSILVLGAALGVASEARQVRRMHRVSTRLRATLYKDDATVLQAQCIDFSMTGVGLQLPGGTPLQVNEKV